MMYENDALKLVENLRNFKGVKYKQAIGKAINEFSKLIPASNRINALNYDDDAAYIEFGGNQNLILISTDGIRNEYTRVDPWGAGYYGVVVNVKDILAMGGMPIGIVNVVCFKDEKSYQLILKGLYEGAKKFNIAVLGGHVCPESNENNVSIAILGQVDRKNLILSSTAKNGQRIIYIADLKGRILPTWRLGWDSTSMKSGIEIQSQLDAINKCFNAHLFRSGKDVSNAGLIGTIGMLCEASRTGAMVDINKIMCPEGVDLELWLKMNPGFGYIFTIREKDVKVCKEILADSNLMVMDIGCITDTNKLELEINSKIYTIWDFNNTSIYGRY